VDGILLHHRCHHAAPEEGVVGRPRLGATELGVDTASRTSGSIGHRQGFGDLADFRELSLDLFGVRRTQCVDQRLPCHVYFVSASLQLLDAGSSRGVRRLCAGEPAGCLSECLVHVRLGLVKTAGDTQPPRRAAKAPECAGL